MFLSCSCRALVMILPWSCHVLAMLLPCCSCHAFAAGARLLPRMGCERLPNHSTLRCTTTRRCRSLRGNNHRPTTATQTPTKNTTTHTPTPTHTHNHKHTHTHTHTHTHAHAHAHTHTQHTHTHTHTHTHAISWHERVNNMPISLHY
jgi:hypothetical protein